MHTEDGNIIHECINGDSASFGLLVDKYKASIFALAYSRLNNFHDAEDVTQEVFLKAYKGLRTLRQWDNFVVWLRSVTINLCKNKIREQSRKRDKFSLKDQNSEIIENASLDSYREEQSSSWRNEALDSLNEALDSLPEQYRQILTLHYLGGMKGEEISKFLSISHDTVRQRLSRARAMLKEEVLAMISTNYRQQKLSASFTFRIIEMVKKIRIQPTSGIKGLPYGLSIGAGIIFAILSFGQHIQINLSDIAMGLPLPSDMKVLKVGEIPVDAVKVSTIISIGSKGDDKGFAPDLKGQDNAFFMAPQGEGGTWKKGNPIPTPRLQLRVEKIGNRIFAIGGSQTPMGKMLATNEEYDPVKDKWIKRADMPIGVEEFASAVVNGKIYVIAGVSDDVQFVPTVFEYNPVTDTWTEKADFPDLVTYINAAVVDGKVYVFGGEGPPNWEVHKTVYEYDPINDKWRQMGDMPLAFDAYGCCSFNEKIYLIGGWNNSGALSAVWEYNPRADTWTKKTDMPTARWCFHAIPIGDKIYAAGGTNGDTLSVLEIYDPEADAWSKGADIPTKRSFYGACEWGGLLMVFSGTTKWNANDVNNPQITDAVESYTPDVTKSVDPSGKLPKTWGTLKAK
jgi:RNA polymerase sigma factor (sigma-70 family)